MESSSAKLGDLVRDLLRELAGVDLELFNFLPKMYEAEKIAMSLLSSWDHQHSQPLSNYK
eukprot:5240876-Ditylum_brightwellii.AAC.1